MCLRGNRKLTVVGRLVQKVEASRMRSCRPLLAKEDHLNLVGQRDSSAQQVERCLCTGPNPWMPQGGRREQTLELLRPPHIGTVLTHIHN